MLPFSLTLATGESPYRQIVFSATRAIVSGELPAGSTFPSVRELSQALKINPNTAQKAIGELVRDGLLEVRPGIGTVVTSGRRASAGERRRLLSAEVDQLIVEAKRMGLTRDEVMNAVGLRWDALFGDGTAVKPSVRGAR
ncbi:MAG: GntR family transcriptional regulator [Gemmatimonadaceae bacterium]